MKRLKKKKIPRITIEENNKSQHFQKLRIIDLNNVIIYKAFLLFFTGYNNYILSYWDFNSFLTIILELLIKNNNFKFVSHFIFNTFKVSNKPTVTILTEIIYRKLQNFYL